MSRKPDFITSLPFRVSFTFFKSSTSNLRSLCLKSRWNQFSYVLRHGNFPLGRYWNHRYLSYGPRDGRPFLEVRPIPPRTAFSLLSCLCTCDFSGLEMSSGKDLCDAFGCLLSGIHDALDQAYWFTLFGIRSHDHNIPSILSLCRQTSLDIDSMTHFCWNVGLLFNQGHQ